MCGENWTFRDMFLRETKRRFTVRYKITIANGKTERYILRRKPPLKTGMEIVNKSLEIYLCLYGYNTFF